MNPYVEQNSCMLPLLAHCAGTGTQEDGIIEYVLLNLRDYAPYAVEFGQRSLGGGTLGAVALAHHFSSLNMDVAAAADEIRAHPANSERVWTLLKRKVCPLNLNAFFAEANVPENPAVVVIDIDGMDYWCALALLQKRKPALLIVEYNCHIPPDLSASLAYNPEHTYKQNKHYGASLKAFTDLANSQGYRLVHIHGPLNLYFVHERQIRDPSIFAFANELENLSANDLGRISDTELFYDSFYLGSRPSWFHTDAPNPKALPWLELDRIGPATHTLRIDEITLQVFSADSGGDHYRQRSHKEDSVSPLWHLIRRALRPATLVDIGANYGYTTSLLAKRLGVRQAIAVEPDPRLAKILEANLKANLNDVEWQIITKCVSSKPEELSAIGLNPNSTQDNRLVAQTNWPEAVVQSTPLARLLEQLQPGESFFIKCDTQGYDMDVLASGWDALQSRRDWMMRLEFAPHWIESQGFDAARELAKVCRAFQVFEGPPRTPYFADLKDVFHHPINESNAADFTTYVRSLNHNGMGWVDLYLFPLQPSFTL
jgi:FkbM family methyltransferase